jgi:hypothetical protein
VLRLSTRWRPLVLVVVSILSWAAGGGAAWAGGILPPNNPPSNIPPNPNIFSACNPGYQFDTSWKCVAASIAAIDQARALEGVGPMDLPANYLSLTPDLQLFVLTNLERVDRGLPPIQGLTTQLNQAALQGAQQEADPTIPPNYPFTLYGSIWAGGLSNPAEAMYLFMYYDGYPGPNGDCNYPSAPGCWSHRDVILASYQCNPCTAGSAAIASSALAYSPSYAEILVGDASGASYSYTATWTSLYANPTPAPVVQGVSPSAVVTGSSTQVTVSGSNLNNAVLVYVGSTPVTSFVSDTSSQLSFVVPSSVASGIYDVRVVTLGGESAQTASDRLVVAPQPQAPASVTAVAGSSTVTVAFSPVGSAPFPVTSYTVTEWVNNAAVASQTIIGSPPPPFAVFTGIASGTSASFSVTASNGYFSSQPTYSSTVTAGSPASPQVAGVYPSAGPTQGGNQVQIYGVNLQGFTSVSFGSASATCQAVSDGQLNCTVPAQAAGVVDVEVASPSGSSPTGPPDRYSYVASYAYQPLAPSRIADTRPGSGYPYAGNTLSQGGSLTIAVAGQGGVPSTAAAAVLNVTVTNTTSWGYLTIYPAGQSRPLASNLNWVAGQTVANTVTVALGTGGAVTVYNAYGSADVVVDVEGYYGPSGGNSYYAMSPVRIADTRSYNGNPYQDAGATLAAGSVVSVNLGSVSQLPSNATGVVMNVTVTDTSGSPSYLTVWPSGSSRPNASVANWVPGQTVANGVYIPVDSTKSVSIYNAYGSADVIVDLEGYFVASSAGLLFVPVVPSRICDTRMAPSSANICGGLTMYQGFVMGFAPYPEGAVPASASVIAVNLTAVNTTSWGYLTAYPYGSSPPNSSNLNWVANQVVANGDLAALGQAGAVALYNALGSTDVVVDLDGYFWPA